jgi:type II secretory pathway component PulC
VTALPEETIVPIKELRTPFRLYGSARVSALYDRHEFRGVRVEEVDEGSLWELIGVRSGDLVVEFNGERVDNPAAGVQLMNALARDESLRLRVRGTDGLERLLDFRFPTS